MVFELVVDEEDQKKLNKEKKETKKEDFIFWLWVLG